MAGHVALRPRAVVLATLAGVTVLSLLVGRASTSGPIGFASFVLAVVLLVYLPGRAVVALTRLEMRPLERLTLSLVLGLAASTLVYLGTALVGLRQLFAIWPLAALVVLVRRGAGSVPFSRPRLVIGWWHVGLLAVIIVCLTPLFVLPFWSSWAEQPNGSVRTAPQFPDATLHVSIAREVAHTVPPQVPFLAQRTLGYHVGSDVTAAMLMELGLDAADVTIRFLPVLFVTTGVLAVVCFTRSWIRSPVTSLFVAALVFLGEDLSFVPGLLSGSEQVWMVQFFQLPSVFSLYTVNPALPALVVLFAALFCLQKYWSQGGGWILPAGFLLAALAAFKIFAAVHAGIALAVTAALAWARWRETSPSKVLGATALFLLPLVAYTLHVQQSSTQSVLLRPLTYVPTMLSELGLADVGPGRTVQSVFEGSPTVGGLALLALVVVPLFLIGVLGARLMAIPMVTRRLRRPPADALRLFLAAFAFVGLPLTLLTAVYSKGYPEDVLFNNSGWFFVQSKQVLWVLVAEVAWRSFARRRMAVFGLLSGILVISLPSTVQWLYVYRQQLSMAEASRAEITAVRSLSPHCRQGETVLAQGTVSSSVLALTSCRLPFVDGIGHAFGPGLTPRADLERRQADVAAFWEAWTRSELRADVLARYNVSYVLAPAGNGPRPANGRLRRTFANEALMVFEVR